MVFIEPFNFSLFSISGWGIDLDYSDIEWFPLKTNRDHSVVFEIVPRYYILDSFTDYEGYSISFNGLFATVVDIMVIRMKSAHPHPFQFTDLRCRCSLSPSLLDHMQCVG